MTTGEVTLNRALTLLSSDKLKERSDGLADLKHILQQSHQRSKLTSLNDKACHRIFESLFRVISAEKASHRKASKSSARAPSVSRLATCASVLRTAVDVLVRNLRLKSIRAVVDHIVDTLSVEGEPLWEVLSVDYTKCLTSLLRYAPHAEHLGDTEWEKVVDFCIQCLAHHEDEVARDSADSPVRHGSKDHDGTSFLSTPSRTASFLALRRKPSDRHGADEELVVCIQLLTASTTAPVQSAAEKILRCLTQYVLNPSRAASAHQAAFTGINTIIGRILFDQSEVVRIYLPDLLSASRRLWSNKLSGLKDELLVTILLCIDLLIDTARREPSESLLQLFATLADTLHLEYLKRPDKDILQLEDLNFTRLTSEHAGLLTFGPRLGVGKAEHNWTILWALSTLWTLSDKLALQLSKATSGPESSTKRQRVVTRIEDALRDACVPSPGLKRICALQLLPFLTCQVADVEVKASLLDKLIPQMVDDNYVVSNWTIIAVASIASGPDAKAAVFNLHWQQIWELASRASSSQLTCRAACHLMYVLLDGNLLESSEISESVRSMLSSTGLNGPASLSDTSLALWAGIARANAQATSGLIPHATRQICAWLREVWSFGTVPDRLHMAHLADFARPLSVFDLISACTNRPFQLPNPPPVGPTGVLGRTWQFQHQNQELLEYLFGVGDLYRFANPWREEVFVQLEPATRLSSEDVLVLDILNAKLDSFSQAWQSSRADTAHPVAVELVQIFGSFCLLSILYTNVLPSQSTHEAEKLRQNSHQLWNGICTFLDGQEDDLSAPFLDMISTILSSAMSQRGIDPVISKTLGLLTSPLASVLENRRRRRRKDVEAETESMDLDDQYSSKLEQLEVHELTGALARNANSVHDDLTSSTTIQLAVIGQLQLRGNEDSNVLQSSVVDYLTSLDDAEMLSAHAIMPSVFQMLSDMGRSTMLRLVEHIGEQCLQRYELERCEASICTCISMMSSFVRSWTAGHHDALDDSAADIYDWFIGVLIARKKASSQVYAALAELFGDVLRCNTIYSVDESKPSPRTCLLTVLQEGDVFVKFGVANSAPKLFDLYSLKDHDAIFDDVLESLPRDPDWSEGLAIRLFVLCQLAARWPTLLRRSIYHLFETPAHVSHSVRYAQKCLVHVSKSLLLDDAKQLFRLFSSQIIYTWTETQDVKKMPFSIFGYDDLRQMLQDVSHEVVGQLMMRGKENEAMEIADILQTPFKELLEQCFCKVEAYCLARDITIPPSQNNQPKGAENRLKKLLGADRFAIQLEACFPQIIAVLFRSLDQYEQIERAFAKRPSFNQASEIMTEILSKSAAKTVPPASQQPSFRARYLLDELDFLCKRIGYEPETIWTPTLTTFVCRSLLESIHPALGSLHACSVIRKLRILVCVAGPVMLREHPMEMLLNGLQPFLSDVHCLADALGIYWYLLDAGEEYLNENPTFMAGIAVSSFAALSRVLSSPEPFQAGSQSNEAIPNIHNFVQWLETLTNNFKSSLWNGLQAQSYQRLIKSSRWLCKSSDSQDAVGEHSLLLEVLKDRAAEHGLLTKQISDLVLSIICADFRTPTTRDWESDSQISDIAHAVWDGAQSATTSTDYRLWAAKMAGRAFSATGRVNENLLREQDTTLLSALQSNSIEETLCQSKMNIIRALCDRLQTSKHYEAGLIERTLQAVISNLTNFPEFDHCGQAIPATVMKALIWSPYQIQPVTESAGRTGIGDQFSLLSIPVSLNTWAANVALNLWKAAPDDPVVGTLDTVIKAIPGLATQLLPYVLHDVLLFHLEKSSPVRERISEVFKQAFDQVTEATVPIARLAIDCILYLRTQPKPRESTFAERDQWLDVDFMKASMAAKTCGIPKTSLLLLEIHASRATTGSRRSSMAKFEPPSELLQDIFKNIDDPDLFYGVQQDSSLASVMEKLDYEASGLKNLLFQSAKYDSDMQMLGEAHSTSLLKALNSTNLQGLAHAIFSATADSKANVSSIDSVFDAAMSLRRWDIPVSPLSSSVSALVYRVLSCLNTSDSIDDAISSIDECLLKVMNLVTHVGRSSIPLREAMSVFGIMAEIDDVLRCTSAIAVEERWQRMATKNKWRKGRGSREAGKLLSWQECLFSSIKSRSSLKSAVNLNDADAQLLEIKVIRQSLRIARDHDSTQASLKAAMALSKRVDVCASMGVPIVAAANFDMANVLWDQGEMSTSIRMLQELAAEDELDKQAIPVSRAELLVTLGHHVAEARLEKPDAIIQEYLAPAVKELNGRSDGEEAGQVFHGFAMFCDQQLQNADGLEDFKRIEQLRDRKEKELSTFEEMMRKAEGKEREALRMYRSKAKQWFDLDDREYQRLRRSREAFLQQCLENYLLCLKASDTYNNDALRFCALWLDKSTSNTANNAVSKYIGQVPSRKFAPLMSQMCSRLLDAPNQFQDILSELIFRICVEHPFHGMYQIFASSKSKGGKDQVSLSRHRAATKLVDRLKTDEQIGPTWVAVHNTNVDYVRFAIERLDEKFKSGAKVALKKLDTGARLEQDVVVYKLPPPTMKIELRPDCTYAGVPTVVRFSPDFTVASGVSAPKIITAIASDGVRYKQLCKGGNDDLRQDAIMEQVFERVSSLLKDHQATQQRNLAIRTYKVLPLTSNAGIIEFVANTIPLNDYLMPAHQRYYPKNMKPSVCRKHISDVQTRSLDQRVRTFRQVAEHFQPVMRYFFMEKFNNPDDWYSKRLAYTRSTAAISILGHVLGLGDRHGHNILLDEQTGEVIHIDLGVAFEQGRVLPVPEVVPFRLTRDLVDGMGITKTEGVFRRCCEFTLEALRHEAYSIMAILDVLRYDPLYSWTVSPLRMKKMQDTQEAAGAPVLPGAAHKHNANEPSEADRALTVVAKKLSKTLSVTATVNELIQQATDERHLAVLYCGWAAYA